LGFLATVFFDLAVTGLRFLTAALAFLFFLAALGADFFVLAIFDSSVC
jgi:hypothetical protein